MIKLENTIDAPMDILKFAIQGMRNPLNSWERSDTTDELGVNDITLMKKLAKSGTAHRKFMRQMPVCVRITAPLYWWKEFDTYKVGTVSNSCSTMHKITERPLTINDFSTEHLSKYAKALFTDTLEFINDERSMYIASKDKGHWWSMIQTLPSSYNQTRNITLNYEVLHNMYYDRCIHKLDEWREFCDWIRNLKYSWLIMED